MIVTYIIRPSEKTRDISQLFNYDLNSIGKLTIRIIFKFSIINRYIHCYSLFFLGSNASTLKIHLVQHTALCVDNWDLCGRIHALALRQIKRFFHGSRNMSKQVAMCYNP